MNLSTLHLTDEQTIATWTHATGIPMTTPTATNSARVDFPAYSAGRAVIRFSVSGADYTYGDGTFGHVLALMGRRLDVNFAMATSWELIAFMGIQMSLGGAPQIPMLNNAGVNPRDFAQVVELLDDYSELALVGFAAAELVPANTTITAKISCFVDDRGGTL